MPRPRLALEIFLVALAALLLEVSYTRIFSYKLVYFFTYVVIGLALLGLGSGGVLVTLARSERRTPIERLLPRLCLAGGVSVALGYLVVAVVQVNAFDIIRHAGSAAAAREVLKLVAVSAALFVPFLCAGLAIAAIFAARPESIGRLYFADLLGAGLGCAACVPLMVLLSPIGCVMLAGAFFALAGIRHARAASPRLTPLLAVTVVACLAAAVVGEARLPEIVTDGVKRMHPANRPPILFSRWSPVFRVDVLESPLFKHVGLALIHDGAVGSILPNVGADPGLLDGFFQKDSRALPLAVVEPEPTVTIIGSAGGSEILTARHLGAARVTGVELNPVTISLLTSHFRDFTGRMTDDPRVRLVNAEGRAYFDGTTERSDLIWFVAPDSYAAMNAATSGAYVLSESYLYTVEMIESALAHLEPRGVVCAQFGEINFPEKPNRTTRYLTTAREAFRRAGITDFSRHVLVATNPGYLFTTSTILLRREPFEPADVERLAAKAATTGSELRFARRPTEPDHPVTAAITLAPAELERWYDGYAWNVRPITDDAPFFWHFIGFPAAFRSALYPGPSATEEGLGERLLLVLLALVTAFAAVALLVPLVVRRTLWRAIPHKLDAGLYFASLGLGFMFFEVTLIQRLTLFLGYPTYALTVTLFALLVSTGIGSLLSERAVAARDRTVLRIGVVLIGLVLFYLFALGPLTARLGGAAFPLRVVVAVLVLFPLGLCLGMFMPLGLRSVAALTPHADAYVAWAWAVNGFFSVVASVLATMLSMTFGFTTVMVIALAIYGVAIVSLRRIPARL